MRRVGGYFTSIFGQSPFGSVQEHMRRCVQAAGLAAELIDAAIAGDFDAAERLQRQISTLEGEADELKGEVRSHLPRGFLLPVARSDLLDLLARQDRIANLAEDIAGIVCGRRMRFPDAITAAMQQFARISVGACEQAGSVVGELDELVESSFTGREAHKVIQMISEVEQRERESDKAQVALRQVLFPLEQQLPAVEVMFLYQVIDLIGELADGAEAVGHRVQLMVAH